MNDIHVAGGVGVAETAMASYDAALADANLHNYNLVAVSSVVPATATVRSVETAPDLGPAGSRLTVVEARRTVGPSTDAGSRGADGDAATAPRRADAVAGLGWATGPGPGLFYEVTGETERGVRDRIGAGLDAGTELRDWTLTDREARVETVAAEPDGHATAVVVAAYGSAEPIL